MVVGRRLLGAILLLGEQLLIGGELARGDTLLEGVCSVRECRRGRCVLVGSSAGKLMLYAGEMMHVQSGRLHYDWGHF